MSAAYKKYGEKARILTKSNDLSVFEKTTQISLYY